MDVFETIRFERRGPVALIELHRPEAANGLNAKMAEELATAARTLDSDDATRVVVLTGAGRFFCAGGDIKEMLSYGDAAGAMVKRLADDVHRAIATFARMRAPLIVAVNGVAAGGGFSLAMAGDLVLAADTATFTMAYSRAGLSPDGGSTYLLPRLIGLRKTQELMFTNRQLSAAEALDWGLLSRVVPAAQLQTEALSLAESLAGGPLNSHDAMKKLLLQTFSNGLETQLELEGRFIAACAGSDAGREGISAFCEKRAPRFNREDAQSSH